MSNNLEKIGSRPDSLNVMSVGMADTTIHVYRNLKTGEICEVITWTGSEDEMEKEAGEAIGKGNFLR